MTTNASGPIWVNVNHPTPAGKPPATEVGVLGWLRANLFSGIWNSLFTILTLVVIYFTITSIVQWVINAYWEPVWANRKLFAVGPYPTDQLIQPTMVLLMVSLLFGVSAGHWGSFLRNLAIGLGALYGVMALIPLGTQTQMVMAIALVTLVVGYLVGLRLPISGRWLTILWILSAPATFILLSGGVTLPALGVAWSFAPLVDPGLWGGLMLTLILSLAGIALSFPLGVLLALGRRSNLPVVKYFSITYIEVIRGVPLITLLFMAMAMLPLFLPAGTTSPAGLLRVLVAITLFSAAYLAENVRGGLQALPQGQYEAADALGLSGVAKLRFIILPQALTKVIPAIVGQFIGLFKDTSLASLVGLLELVGVAKSVIQQPEWLGTPGGVSKEVYIFVALVFFIFSFGMSFASRKLETQLGVGKR